MIKFDEIIAHCDIPCKVYDPAIAQYAALSVIRLIDLIHEVDESMPARNFSAQIARLSSSKEEQAQTVKDEIAVIWGGLLQRPSD